MTLSNLQTISYSALKILYETIEELLKMYPDGLTNSEIAHNLELGSSHENAQHDYLTYSLLGNMMKVGKVKKTKIKRKVLYILL